MHSQPDDRRDPDVVEPELARELIERKERDQEARWAVLPHSTPEQWREVVQPVDDANLPRITEIIDRYGWPGYALVGRRAASAAWLLVQHAPLDLQERALPLLRAAVAAGDADPANLAYLEDRVNVRNDRPQRYGTQTQVEGGEAAPYPLADPEHVDELRAEVGLEPLADYLADIKRTYEGA